MIKRLVLGTFVMFVLTAGVTVVSAQEWHSLGSKEVKDQSEQDTWHLGSSKGQFRKLKLTITRRAVRFYKFEVTYSNGEKDTIEVRSLIPAGGETRAIDLKGDDRYINKVDIWYEASSAGKGQRSVVTLWGYK